MKSDEPNAAIATRSSRERSPRKGGWRKFVPFAIAALIAFGITVGLMPRPIKVEVAEVTRGPLTVSVLEEGKTRIRHRHVISPPISGFLNRVELRAGARVEAGKTVLATIQAESAGFLNPRARAEADARLQGAQASRMNRSAELDRAKAQLALAQKELARAETLKRTGAIAINEWDAAENRADVLNRGLRAAEFALRVADFDVAQAQAALVQARESTLSNSEPLNIVSPINGYVLNVYEESARVVTAGMPIMEIGDPQDLEAEIELLSSDAVAVQPGASVSIEQWGGGAPLKGRVSVVEPGAFTKISALGVEEQRVKVRVDFIDSFPEGREMGDRYRVEARIETWHADNVLQAPLGALFRRGNEWMTFVFHNGRARLQRIEIGHSNGAAAEILSGLTEGEQVILHPPDATTEGVRVSQ